jgi:hypothetical protein
VGEQRRKGVALAAKRKVLDRLAMGLLENISTRFVVSVLCKIYSLAPLNMWLAITCLI